MARKRVVLRVEGVDRMGTTDWGRPGVYWGWLFRSFGTSEPLSGIGVTCGL